MHSKTWLLLLLIPFLLLVQEPEAKAKAYHLQTNIKVVNQGPGHHKNHRQAYYSMANRLHFYSQRYPRYSSCCESASLLMALSVKNHAHNMSLTHFTQKKIGWFNSGNRAKEVNYRYDRDPYRQSATIYPRGMARVARKMGAKPKIIDHASKNKIIYYLKHNDPIVVEASYHLEIWVANHTRQSDHVICLIGYTRTHNGREYIQYADPFYGHRKNGIRWGTMNQFLKSYQRPITGERALVILK